MRLLTSINSTWKPTNNVEARPQSPSLPTQGPPAIVHLKTNSQQLVLTWQSTVVCCFFFILVWGRAPHVTCVIPLEWDGVHTDRGLTAWSFVTLSGWHKVAKGLWGRGPVTDGLLMPEIILDFSRVFWVCLIFRGFFFIIQTLKINNSYGMLVRTNIHS